MLENQKQLFNLEDNSTYLNCATMSPQLRSIEDIGIANLRRKSNPQQIETRHFFEDRELLKHRFAKLIGCHDPGSVAIIPSVSYGIATVLRNIPLERGDELILLDEQFPSNYYAWSAAARERSARLVIVKAPSLEPGRGKMWNERILEAITYKTKVISIPNVHWADGTRFNLRAIRQRADEVGAFLIVDGTQSIGAIPFSVSEIRPDALICAGYKWLMGPYGLGMAYFGERFHQGEPIENNWINHEGSDDFTKLVQYNETFKPKATRFDMGESSNFILVPMLSEGIRQLLEWTPEAIQAYCERITKLPLKQLHERQYFIEPGEYRASHLFGIYPKAEKSLESLKKTLSDAGIAVSFRGNAVRVSPHVYNTEKDIEKLISCFI